MIIIKTTNGDVLVNESQIKRVSHDKKTASVTIEFITFEFKTYFQVESMIYTNKQDMEVSDRGLMLTAAINDAEYYKQMNESACSYLKRMDEQRSELENMVISMYEVPDCNLEYRKHYVEELREALAKRPGTIMDELGEHRTMDYYARLRKECHEKGEEVKKEFARLVALVEESEKWRDRYEKALQRLMDRPLWQRIINKKNVFINPPKQSRLWERTTDNDSTRWASDSPTAALSTK